MTSADRRQDLRDCSLGSLAELSLILSKVPPTWEVLSGSVLRVFAIVPGLSSDDEHEDDSKENRACRGAAALPSLDKQGKTAARGCCRGG